MAKINPFSNMLEKDLDTTGLVLTGTQVIAGTGLDGGGALTSNVTLSLEPSGVVPGSYTNSDITVDAFGRLTAAASGTAAPEDKIGRLFMLMGA